MKRDANYSVPNEEGRKLKAYHGVTHPTHPLDHEQETLGIYNEKPFTIEIKQKYCTVQLQLATAISSTRTKSHEQFGDNCQRYLQSVSR
jgi:hypothetical protein